MSFNGLWEPNGIAPNAPKGKVTKMICVQEVDNGGATSGCGHDLQKGPCPRPHIARPTAFVRRVANGDQRRHGYIGRF